MSDSFDIPTVSASPAFFDPDRFLCGEVTTTTFVSDGALCGTIPPGTPVFVGANDFGDLQRVYLGRNTSFTALVPRHEIIPEGDDGTWWDR